MGLDSFHCLEDTARITQDQNFDRSIRSFERSKRWREFTFQASSRLINQCKYHNFIWLVPRMLCKQRAKLAIKKTTKKHFVSKKSRTKQRICGLTSRPRDMNLSSSSLSISLNKTRESSIMLGLAAVMQCLQDGKVSRVNTYICRWTAASYLNRFSVNWT